MRKTLSIAVLVAAAVAGLEKSAKADITVHDGSSHSLLVVPTGIQIYWFLIVNVRTHEGKFVSPPKDGATYEVPNLWELKLVGMNNGGQPVDHQFRLYSSMDMDIVEQVGSLDPTTIHVPAYHWVSCDTILQFLYWEVTETYTVFEGATLKYQVIVYHNN